MIDLGVGAGDRVAIWSPNTWHWVVACLATHLRRRRARATEHPLHRQRGQRHPGADRRTAVVRIRRVPRRRQCGFGSTATPCRNCATSSGYRSRRTTEPGTSSSRGGADLDAVDARAAAVQPDDVSDILFTSGTTGRSKGALCAHRQSLAGSAAWAECGEITSDDRYLCINPFFHNFGYKAGILACLQTGATLIPQLTFDPEQAMRAVPTIASPCCPGRRRSIRRCSTTPSAATTTCPRCGSRSPARRSFRSCSSNACRPSSTSTSCSPRTA